MVETSFFPLDISYKTTSEGTNLYLYGITVDNQQIAVVESFFPYFYVEGKGDFTLLRKEIEKIQTEYRKKILKVVKTKPVEKNYQNQTIKLIKVYVNYPEAKRQLARKIEESGLKCFEHDILYIYQYLRDRKITPLALTKVEGQYTSEKSRVPVLVASKVEPESSEMLSNLRILAFDIETYAKERAIIPEKNPILMLAFYGLQKVIDPETKETKEVPFKKVITWKRFKTDLNYIEFVDSEEKLIRRFKELLEVYKPDILTGYFSDGFDLPYIQKRAEVYKIRLDVGIDYSNLMIKKRNQSVGKIVGLVHLDVYKFVRKIAGRSMQTESYSLDAVASELLGHRKHDVNLDNLAKVWDSRPEELEEFCKYNLHDAYMTYELCHKLMPNLLELVNLIGLPLFEINRMSFSRLVENYILKRSKEFDLLANNHPKHQEVEWRRGQTYMGAFVFEPEPGLYENLAVFDFRSLYPTIIAAHNIGPDTLNCECCQDLEKVPGKDYWFCRKKKGFFSKIVQDLISRRMRIKEMIAYKKKKKEGTALLEARSYGLKTIANSFYGYMGFFAARWYCLECVRSITAYARDYIKRTMKKAEEKGFKIVYGDSLPPERRIFVLTPDNEIKLVSIGNFVDDNLNNKEITKFKTLSYSDGKLIFNSIKKVIRHQYNSREKGNLLEIITTHGKTVVTPQHSIYGLVGNKICLTDASLKKKQDSLISLTCVPILEKYKTDSIFDLSKLNFGYFENEIYFYKDNYRFFGKRDICPYCGKHVILAAHVYRKHQDRATAKKKVVDQAFKWVGVKNKKGGKIPRYWQLTEELAWVLGYYCADGSVSDCMTKTNRKCMVSFGSQDIDKISRVKNFFDGILKENLKIIRSFDQRINKTMYYYRIQRAAIVALFQFGFGCGKGSEGKKVPTFIFTAEEKIKRAFVQGYCAGDGTQRAEKKYKTHFIQCDTNSKDLACGLQYLFKSLNHSQNYFKKTIKHVGWKYRKDKEKISSLRVQSAKKQDNKLNYHPALIKEIKEHKYQGFVYDLEVAGAHNFVDAEGLILVHNTDSLMILLGDKTKEEALDFMHEINQALPEFMELEFEGLNPRGIFVAAKGTKYGAKKKYALFDGEKVKVVGFEAVRRNWSLIAKETQDRVLKIILRENDVNQALEYVREVVSKLRKREVELSKLVIKTQITRPIETYESIGPHVAVAKRMIERGQEVVPGTLISFVVGKGTGLVRERAKLVEELKEGEYDVDYYVKSQIIPAVNSIFLVLGYQEEDILKEKEQKGLGEWF